MTKRGVSRTVQRSWATRPVQKRQASGSTEIEVKIVWSRGQWDNLTVRSRWDDLPSAILTTRALWRDLAARSRQYELNGASGLGAVIWAQRCEPDLTLSSLSSCSLSLSLSARLSLEIIWRENRSVKFFPGQSYKTHGQMKLFSGKFYFPCATKHTVSRKTISWNGFTPKQTQPKQTKFTIFLR